MAVINYTQQAVLGAYQSWLMEQGARACLDRVIIGQDGPKRPLASCGPYAQAGTSIRYTVSTTLASASVFFAGQFQTDEGKWANVGETVTATSAGGVKQIVRPAVAGSYANMVASVGGATVGEGEVYVVAELGRQNNGAFVPYAVLFKGYPESNTPLDICSGTFMQNKPQTATGGNCVCPTTFVLQGMDIIGGGQAAEALRTPAAGTKERLVVAVVTATLGGGAGLRALQFDWRDDVVGQVGRIRTPDTLAASTFYSLNGYVETSPIVATGVFHYVSLPSSIYMTAPWRMLSDIEQFQTGDTINDSYGVVEVTS